MQDASAAEVCKAIVSLSSSVAEVKSSLANGTHSKRPLVVAERHNVPSSKRSSGIGQLAQSEVPREVQAEQVCAAAATDCFSHKASLSLQEGRQRRILGLASLMRQ